MASTVVAEGSVEFKVFKKNFAYLKDGLKKELDAFVPLLYEKDLVTPENRDKALGTADINKRTIDLLTAIECQVKTNPNAFSSFLGVLKSVPALGHLATKLEGDYDHMVKPPLDSYSAETPTDPCGSQLVAPLEADDENEKKEVCQRNNGAATIPHSSSTMQPSDSTCVPPHSTQLDTKPSEPDVHFFLSPTPETSHESRSDIVGGPLPLAENGQPPRHSLSVPGSASTRTTCVTHPEFRREFRSKLKDLEEFVDASYGQKEEEVEAKNTELAQTSNEVQRQSKELLELVLRLEEAEHQHEEDEAEIHSYQEELRQVESQHEKEKERLESQLLAKTKEHEGMIVAVSQLAERCKELDQRLKSERKEHKQEIQHLEQEVDSLKLENVHLDEENTSLCEEVKQKEADVRQKEMEIDNLKQRLASIDSEFSKQQDEIQLKIKQKKCISRSRLNSAELLDIEAQMKQSVSQLNVFVENEDPALKKLISDIQQLFQVYDRNWQRSISWPSSLYNLPSLAKLGLATQDL